MGLFLVSSYGAIYIIGKKEPCSGDEPLTVHSEKEFKGGFEVK